MGMLGHGEERGAPQGGVQRGYPDNAFELQSREGKGGVSRKTERKSTGAA